MPPTVDPDDDTAPDTWRCPECGCENWIYLVECQRCGGPASLNNDTIQAALDEDPAPRSPLTLEKILEAKRILEEHELDTTEPLLFPLNGGHVTDLRSLPEDAYILGLCDGQPIWVIP